METEYSEKLSEKEYYTKKITELKTFNYHNSDYYQVGKFLDIMDDSRNWCVGQIIDRIGDTITVHYEGCNSKSDEVIQIKKTNKYNQFRKFSRGYSGLKKSAIRNYVFNIEDLKEIERDIKMFTDSKFSEVNDPIQFTQLFRGKIFTYFDIFMTTTINSKDQPNHISAVHNLLCEYINMSYEYFLFYKENMHIVNNYLIKNKDLYLVDAKCAILASIYEVIVTLKRILGEDPRVSEFYKTNEEFIKKFYKPGTSTTNAVLPCLNVKTKICIDKAYKINSEYNKLPAIIIASMIDYFYERNVFAVLWGILLNNQSTILTTSNSFLQPHAHFDTMEVILSFFQLYKIIIDFKTIFTEEISQFKPYFTSRIMNLSEIEIKEVRRGIIVNAIRYLSFLIPLDLKHQRFFFEELYLTYFYKCLTSKNLEKRIAGITAINLIIETVERKEMARVDANSYQSNGNKIEIDDNIEITDSKSLISFFKEKNFLDALLGENLHEEIIKRAVNIFRLLAKKKSNLLNEIVYDSMWKNYEEKHESIAIQIENIICELSFYITDMEKLYLFNIIKSYAEKMSIGKFSNPFSTDSNFFPITRKIVNFIKNFTENCVKKSSFTLLNSVDLDDEKLYGLPLLWNFMQDVNFQIDSSSNQMLTDNYTSQNIPQILEIIELSSESISNLLNLENVDLDAIKEKVLVKCFENIKTNTSVVQSMNLIRKILQELPNYISKKIVKLNDEKYSIINLIINNLETYLTKTRGMMLFKIEDEKRISNSNIITNSNMLNITFEGYYSHKTNIEARLDLIYFFCNQIKERGKLILSSDCVLRIWNVLVLESKNEMENNLFLESIRKNCEYFDNFISDFIFNKILLNKELFPFSKINPTSFTFFEKLFYTVNMTNKKIVYDGKSYRTQLEDIIGLESLYDIICEAENVTVRNKFAKLLSQLFSDFKIYNEDMCNRFWKKGIEKILEILEENFKSKNEIAIKGIISFVKYLIKEMGNPGEIPQHDDVSFPREGIEYTFIYPEKNDTRTIRVGKSEFTCDVRYRVAFFFDIPINCLKLKTKQKLIELNEDFKQFVDICQYNSPVEIKEGPHPILNLKNNPKNLLMRDAKLNKILYELLHNSHASYIQDVWELINILPKNIELEEEILQIGKKDFGKDSIDMNKYFDDQSIYVMSYSLKMIKCIIFTKPEASETLKESINKEWIQNFSNNNGLIHLIKLVYQFKMEDFSSELGFECLNDLLYILKHFNEVTNCLEMDSDILIQKVFEIIHLIILSSIEKDKDVKLKELQDNFIKRKEREFFKNQTGNENFNTTTNFFTDLNGERDEEVCEEILKIFNSEDESIRNLLSFIDDMASHCKDSKSVYKNLLNSSSLKEIVTFDLIIPQNFKFKNTLKRFFKNLLDLLSFEEEELAKILKKALFEFMLNKETFSLANKHEKTCGYFFNILTAMLEEYLEPSMFAVGKDGLDLNSLTEFLIDYIINKESSYENTDENYYVLEGYLLILRVLIIKSRELFEIVNKNYNLIDLILNKCLLLKCQEKSTSASFPKCSTPSSRESAYKLLAALSYNNPEITLQITNVLNNYHMLGYWKSKRLFDWKISLANDEKSSSGYVGLKNLGCTCYMNSLIQQFFMIPELRESLLASPDSNITDISKPELSSLYQIKNIFASLKAYDGQYYNAKDFCLNFDGAVLDIKEQMDVDEFYNTLIDKLENHTKGTPFQNIFKHFFGFSISDEFICKGCPHYSEREQYFNSIQLQVVNKKTITESLKSYIEGELLEGDNAYYCDKCDKKVNTLKRQCIKNLPRILIIVLKRFEFDYENMIKIKVNDYLEFPHELNMEPYTQEYLEKIEKINKNNSDSMGESSITNQNVELNEEISVDGQNVENTMNDVNSKDKNQNNSDKKSENGLIENKPSNYYKYNLSGVVIHSGTSENGHYYSIIKDYLKNNWYEFNDTNVKDYDINDLNSEAFGGTEVIYKDNKKETVEKTTNAYLLFYKRQFDEKEEVEIKKEEEVKVEEVDKIESEGKNFDNHSHSNSIVSHKIEENKIPKQIVIRKWDKHSNISPTIMDRIDLDNFQYWVSKIIFSTEYHSFITDLLVNSNLCEIAVYNYSTKNDNKELFSHLNFLRCNNKSAFNDKIEIELQEIKTVKQNKKNESHPYKIKNLNIDSNIIIDPSVYNQNDFVIVANQEYEFNLFKFACLFFFNVLIRARDKNYLPAVLDWLKAMINKNDLYANWLLEEFSNYELITEYLIDPPLGDIKKLMVGLIYCAMISSYKSFYNNYPSEYSIDSNKCLITFVGNLIAYMQRNPDKDLSSVYYVIYRFSILGEQSKLFLINSGCLHFLAYFYVNKVTSGNSNSVICFTKPIDAISYLKLRDLSTSSHKELDQKLMNKVDKLSAWEELTEKKFTEKFSQRNEHNLLMIFSELVCAANINARNIPSAIVSSNLKLDIDLLQVLSFNNTDLIRCLLLEVKTKQAVFSLSKLFCNLCMNNMDNTNALQLVLLDLICSMDSGDFDYILIIFKRFMLDIDDSFRDIRIKSCLLKYFQIILENSRYWSYMDASIDFVLKLFLGNMEILKNYVDGIKDNIIKLVKYLKENPCPPTMIQSKTQNMYKRRQVMLPNKVSQFQMNAFNTKYTNIANDKINKMKEIFNKNSNKLYQYDPDLDLTDFKFLIGDKVKFEGYLANVVNVLDEMIYIQYDKLEISNVKRPATQWVETDNRNLYLIELTPESSSYENKFEEDKKMNVDK